jgi:hypothetical protein
MTRSTLGRRPRFESWFRQDHQARLLVPMLVPTDLISPCSALTSAGSRPSNVRVPIAGRAPSIDPQTPGVLARNEPFSRSLAKTHVTSYPLPHLKTRLIAGFSPMEPAGIEPATSCLQSRRSPN